MRTIEWSFKARLQEAAKSASASSFLNTDLAQAWCELAVGRERVVDRFYTDERCYLVLEARTPPSWFRQPSARRNVNILERVLLGQAQKAIALDLDLAPSTVAFSVAECLQSLGLTRRVCRVPTLVVGAVHACYGLTDQRTATVALVEYAGETYRVLSSPRPEVALMRRLSPAEYSVTRLLVEGASHAEIASRRGASTRTVANQLATVFQKLRISGRSELLCLALRLRSLEPEAGKPARTPAAPTAPVPAPISQALAPALMLPGARAATY